jgi:hypothetical protein
MKALGIPNNKDFFEVTQIADAQSLWKTIQVRAGLVVGLGCVLGAHVSETGPGLGGGVGQLHGP